MTNEEFAKLCNHEILHSHMSSRLEDDILSVIKEHNLIVIPAPKNPHKHFDLAVEAYGDTTIKWQIKVIDWEDLTTDSPSFYPQCEYRKKPKTLRFRNYKYKDENGETKIGIATIDDIYFTAPAMEHEWIGDWKEVGI